MYKWIQSLLGTPSESSSLHKEAPSSQEKINSFDQKEESTKTKVYIWDTTVKGVGHAAIEVPGANAGEPPVYVSIHPDGFPSMGPTSILPLPAHLATTLEEDMEIEGSAKKTRSTEFDLLPNLATDETHVSTPPDQVFELENLNTSAMLEHIKTIKETVQSGKTTYQLFPQVNIGKWLEDSPHFVNQDPLDIHCYQQSKVDTLPSSSAKNCSTLVADILKSGGSPIHVSSKAPWGISPNGLAEQLDSLAQSNIKI